MIGHYIQLIQVKIFANLKAESSRYYLSYLWWAIEPILYMSVFYVVFGLLLKRGTDDFVAYLMVGLIPWFWFYKTVTQAMPSILQARQLMLQVNLPKVIFPLIVVGQNFAKEIVVLLLLFIFLFFIGVEVISTWMYFPIIVFVQLLLIMACSLIVAAIVPFVPDVQFFVTSGLQLLMFISGVFYATKSIPETFQDLFFMNPIAALLREYRNILLYGEMPNWGFLALIACVSIVLLFLAFAFIYRQDKKYPRVVL